MKYLSGILVALLATFAGISPAYAQNIQRSQDTYAGPASIQTKTSGGKDIAMPVTPCVFLDGSGVPVACSAANPLPVTGGSGGGGGDASAANQVTLNTAIGAVTASPTQYTIGDRLKTINTTLSGTLTVGLPSGASTAANQSTGNTSLGTIAAGFGTLGSTAPTTGQLAGGINPAGNQKGLMTDTGGRLLPSQGAVTSTRTTLTASTATALEAAGVSARIGTSITTEATLTANVYICTSQTTSCSATVYDFLIPNGAVAGTIFNPLFGTTGRLYAYSTGTPVLVLNSWVAQ